VFCRVTDVSEGTPDNSAGRFASNMRARRELRGWSQRQLAQALVELGHPTFRQQTVAEIESGYRQVKLDEALALSRALGMSVENLIRPAGLTARAGELLAAAWETQDANRHARHWAAKHASARRRLLRAIETADREDGLADELAVARRTLAETND
jgi:transcriptional regulator with XRE-family HTH domain